MKKLIKIDFYRTKDGEYKATSNQYKDYCYKEKDIIKFFEGLEKSIKDHLADGLLSTILEQVSFGTGNPEFGFPCLFYTMYKTDGGE